MALDQPVFYKDIAGLPSQLWEQWKKACQGELEALYKRKVFELADLPKGCKAIKNKPKASLRLKALTLIRSSHQLSGTSPYAYY